MATTLDYKHGKIEPTRYKMSFEFVLRYPSDYQSVTNKLRAALDDVEETTHNFAPDYLAFEKVETK